MSRVSKSIQQVLERAKEKAMGGAGYVPSIPELDEEWNGKGERVDGDVISQHDAERNESDGQGRKRKKLGNTASARSPSSSPRKKRRTDLISASRSRISFSTRDDRHSPALLSHFRPSNRRAGQVTPPRSLRQRTSQALLQHGSIDRGGRNQGKDDDSLHPSDSISQLNQSLSSPPPPPRVIPEQDPTHPHIIDPSYFPAPSGSFYSPRNLKGTGVGAGGSTTGSRMTGGGTRKRKSTPEIPRGSAFVDYEMTLRGMTTFPTEQEMEMDEGEDPFGIIKSVKDFRRKHPPMTVRSESKEEQGKREQSEERMGKMDTAGKMREAWDEEGLYIDNHHPPSPAVPASITAPLSPDYLPTAAEILSPPIVAPEHSVGELQEEGGMENAGKKKKGKGKTGGIEPKEKALKPLSTEELICSLPRVSGRRVKRVVLDDEAASEDVSEEEERRYDRLEPRKRRGASLASTAFRRTRGASVLSTASRPSSRSVRGASVLSSTSTRRQPMRKKRKGQGEAQGGEEEDKHGTGSSVERRKARMEGVDDWKLEEEWVV
ncbi:hypothetical protein BT69DRAFT_1283832 [Atractiella rhizophila]|nr:hypothetical protein BT69DRAFT_1283832 [Atractiella rhizophila]